jgi:DNA-binding winged helix-turn-helix (wHTH) protein/Flp pilus assembly protein TadD
MPIGPWTLDPASGELDVGGAKIRLAPKSALLLASLASVPGRVVSREEISEALWPGAVVGEDSLARQISILRKALGDDPKSPRFIETLPKRGYRLVVAAASAGAIPAAGPDKSRLRVGSALAVLLLAVAATGVALVGPSDAPSVVPGGEPRAEDPVLARADDFYFQYERADNEAAIELYERVIAAKPDDPNALAGLANALVQRALRWPLSADDGRGEITKLAEGLRSGRLGEPAALRQLVRANQLAADAVRLAPDLEASHKALGFAQSAAGRFDAALLSYERALAIDPAAWGVLINIADVLEIIGRNAEAMPYLARAYEAMSKAYPTESARIRPWQAQLGVAIAERHLSAGDQAAGERWLREVLALSPLDPQATRRLAAVLAAAGAGDEATRLCRNYAERTGDAVC